MSELSEVTCQVIRRQAHVALVVDSPNGTVVSWEILMRLKNEYLGHDTVAVEIYPAASDVVNETNRRWLWVVDAELPNLARGSTT